MAGHSKWAQVKHKKALSDAKRSQIFSKVAALISVAAREGGDPNQNPKLRDAIEKARSFNMPQENIERALGRGTGAIPGALLEEMYYGAYGPGGVAIIIKTITENKNRTLAELRHVFKDHGAKLTDLASVRWLFRQQGADFIPKNTVPIENPETRAQLEALFEALDEGNDVEEIYSNAELQ